MANKNRNRPRAGATPPLAAVIPPLAGGGTGSSAMDDAIASADPGSIVNTGGSAVASAVAPIVGAPAPGASPWPGRIVAGVLALLVFFGLWKLAGTSSIVALGAALLLLGWLLWWKG
ncbi:MAG: hypothetical protein L6R43_18430 [Planctomycetes bacterium]|nr:hypothetical protein [Planctomycetota bacterium]